MTRVYKTVHWTLSCNYSSQHRTEKKISDVKLTNIFQTKLNDYIEWNETFVLVLLLHCVLVMKYMKYSFFPVRYGNFLVRDCVTSSVIVSNIH